MICRLCARSADASAAVSSMIVLSSVQRQMLDAVARLHERCRGRSWCDCQHRAPAVTR